MNYRLFLALPLSERTKDFIALYQSSMKLKAGSSAMWFPPKDSFHITLKFIGDTSESELKDIIYNYRNVAKQSPEFLSILIGGQISAFTTKGMCRVVYIPFTPSDNYTKLVDLVRPNNPPKSHITLCKKGYDFYLTDLELFTKSFYNSFRRVPFTQEHIDRMVLYHSPMGLDEPEYEVVEEFVLGK